MKQRVKEYRRRLLPILAVLSMSMPATAFAQDIEKNKNGNAPMESDGSVDTPLSTMDTANPLDELKEMLPSDPATVDGLTGKDGSCGLDEDMSAEPRQNIDCK